MHSNGPGGCHKVPTKASTGNVDPDGQIVGVAGRLRRLSPGMEAVPGFDLEEHLRLVAGEVSRTAARGGLPFPAALERP